MKILHVIDSIDIGGAEKLLCNTISELKEFEHLVVTLFPSKDLALVPLNAKHICLNAKTVLNLPSKRSSFKRILKEYRPHIVHSHLYFATVFAKWLTPSSIPLVFTQHFEFSKNAEKWYYRVVDRLVSKKWHTCIAVSNVVLKDYLNTTSFKGKTKIIGNYIPDKYFIEGDKKNYNNRALKLVALGNIKPIKNQQFILDAFEHLRDLNVSCDIYGNGLQKEELAKQAKERNLKVYFKGIIADSSKVLANYDIFIMPSLTEGFPLSLFEAMATGLPVIVSDIPVFHEVLDDKGNYIPLSNPERLRTIIKQYIDDTSLLKKESEEMKQLAICKADRKVFFDQLKGVYKNELDKS